MTLGKRIKYLREKENIKRAQLADSIGLSYHALSKYETGEREPEYDILCRIARYFHVSVDFLLGFNDPALYPSLVAESGPAWDYDCKLPVLGLLQPGVPLLTAVNFQGELQVPENLKGGFALRMADDSMIGAGFLVGDYVVCREAETARNGQIVAVIQNHPDGTGEAILRFYFTNEKRKILRAAHPTLPDIDIKDGFRLAGIMVGMIRTEPPDYYIYRDYLMMSGDQGWAEVIELASSAGLKSRQVKEILAAQVEIAKRLKD